MKGQTSRQPHTGHDGSDPADALCRPPKLILEGHKEDPKSFQSTHHQDVNLEFKGIKG